MKNIGSTQQLLFLNCKYNDQTWIHNKIIRAWKYIWAQIDFIPYTKKKIAKMYIIDFWNLLYLVKLTSIVVGNVYFIFLVFNALSIFLNSFKLEIFFCCCYFIFYNLLYFLFLGRKVNLVFRGIFYDLGYYHPFGLKSEKSTVMIHWNWLLWTFMIYGPGVNVFTVNSCTRGWIHFESIDWVSPEPVQDGVLAALPMQSYPSS